MREKVIVIGAGIAGLTAAHELVERDFEVHVYERRPYIGGKSASVVVGADKVFDPVPGPTSSPNVAALPGEHGFRFFAGWYRHLPDTLRRIPYLGQRELYDGRTVWDNLLALSSSTLTWSGRDPVRLPLRVPTHLIGLAQAGEFLGSFTRLGFKVGDVAFFIAKLAPFLALSDEELVERFEGVSWWEYLDCENRSTAFKDLVRATTRTMVAAKAEEASAYTIGRLAVRTLVDTLGTVDRILDGPTSAAWLEPWRRYLESRGVQFHCGWELDAITLSPNAGKVDSVSFERFALAEARRLRHVLPKIRRRLCELKLIQADNPLIEDEDGRRAVHLSPGTRAAITGASRGLLSDFRAVRDGVASLRSEPNEFVNDDIKDAASNLADELGETRLKLEVIVDRKSPLPDIELIRALEVIVTTIEKSFAQLAPVEAYAPPARMVSPIPVSSLEIALAKNERTKKPLVIDDGEYFVFALPLEQMAYYVNRSQALLAAAPELKSLVQLSDHLDWMSGIQFYLKERFDGPQGHIVCMDSEWALTVIEQSREWHDVKLPSGVKAILSVDIAAWDRRGRFVRKEPYNCTDDEIAREVWEQLKVQLNGPATVVRDDMLVEVKAAAKLSEPGPRFERKLNYHLDAALVDLRDRKKQALYERARGVHARRLAGQRGLNESFVPQAYMWGPHSRYNAEPLLVNRAGSRRLRPSARTAIRNLFLAADYVLTETDLACMEAANEAARNAVNGILEATSSEHDPCRIWKLSLIPDVGVPSAAAGVRAALNTADTVSKAFQAMGSRFVGDFAARIANMTFSTRNRK